MATIITSNGKTNVIHHIKGSVSIVNGKFYQNGKEIDINTAGEEPEMSHVINIELHDCEIERLEVESCKEIHITGNVRRVKTAYGDIKVTGDVEGDVHTNMGDIDCGTVHGDCHTNMGNIRRK